MKNSIGYAFRQLDAAMEHINPAWFRIMHLTGHPEKIHEQPNTNGLSPANPEYNMAAAFEYARKAYEILAQHVPNEWQLCPYEGCSWGCGVETEGYYICPHCGKVFLARTSDSDIEDWHFERTKDGVFPNVQLATDFGPSWASAEE